MKYDPHAIDKMSADEYLQFLLDVYFRNYIDKKILMGVYDVQKRGKFSTELSKKIFSYTEPDFFNLTPDQQPVLQKFPKVLALINNTFDLVLSRGDSYTCVIFDRINSHFGAMHLRVDPIFHGNIICGIVTRSYNFTKLWFGVDKFTTRIENHEKVVISADDLMVLTARQKQMLFLLLMGFTQDRIAESFHITRGTVVKTVANICDRFNLKKNSFYYLQSVIDRASVLKELSLPEIEFEPVAIMFTHDLEAPEPEPWV